MNPRALWLTIFAIAATNSIGYSQIRQGVAPKPTKCVLGKNNIGVCRSAKECPGVVGSGLRSDCKGDKPICCPAKVAYSNLYKYADTCGIRSSAPQAPAMYIIGGEEVVPHSWPWMVSIEFKVSESKILPICGGSLITKKHILSSAHCFYTAAEDGAQILSNPDNYRIVLGAHNISQKSELVYNVVKFTVHPNHRMELTMYDDMAIAELDKEVDITKNVVPVCLPETVQEDFEADKDKVTVLGWGMDFSGERPQTHKLLQQLSVPIVSRSVCNMTYWKTYRETSKKTRVIITDKMFCAGEIEPKTQDACQGDSGGPVLYEIGKNRWKLAGIVTFGHSCADGVFPGVYTKIAPYIPWVSEVVGSK